MEILQLRQARDHDRLSQSAVRDPWAGFDVINEHILPHIKRCHATNEELISTDRMVAAGEEGVVYRPAAAREEHDLATVLRKMAVKLYLGIDECPSI